VSDEVPEAQDVRGAQSVPGAQDVPTAPDVRGAQPARGAAADADGPDRRPILVARPAGRGQELVERLEADGFLVEHCPFLQLVLAEPSELRDDLTDLADGAFSHLVVTSRTTIEALAAAATSTAAGQVTVPSTTRVIAVGRGTAAALAAAGVRADEIAGGSGAALVEQMPPSAGGELLWFPASAAASSTVPAGLTAKGYRVRRTVAYRPESVELPAEVAGGLPAGRYAAVVLTSPMLARLAAAAGVDPSTSVVTIGDPTSAGARAAGLTVTVQAGSPDNAALAHAVRQAVADHSLRPSRSKESS